MSVNHPRNSPHFIPIRRDIFSSTSPGSRAQSASGVVTFDDADGDRQAVRPAVTHHANAANREEHGESLPESFRRGPPRLIFFADDCIGLRRSFQMVCCHFAQ